jgi:hypothetical protein
MFKLFEAVQLEDCKGPLPKNIYSKELMVFSSDTSHEIQDTYFNMLKYMTKIVSLLKNYYKDGHNPCLKKESPYICPVGQNYVQSMYIGEIFGVILYQASSKESSTSETSKKRVLPDMCYVDYDAISAFLTYYKLELARFNELVSELTSKLPTSKNLTPSDRKQIEDIQATIKQVTTVAKRSKEFVLHCIQQDLKGVHTYKVTFSAGVQRTDRPSGRREAAKVIPNKGYTSTSIYDQFEECKIPVTIAIQETPQELIQKLKLDPKHLPYHILIRAKTPIITVEKLPLFHDEFMKHLVETLS